MTDRALRRLPRNDRPHRLDFIGAALKLMHTPSGTDFAEPFRLVFVAAAAFLASALVAISAIEEHPLHGPARPQGPAK